MRSILAAALIAVVSPAVAAKEKVSCLSAADAQKSAIEHGGKWIDMTPGQWEFLRGISALNPATPAGLPPGNKAALVKFGDHSGIVFFIDGTRACTPMEAPEELIKMIEAVAKDVIPHEGDDL